MITRLKYTNALLLLVCDQYPLVHIVRKHASNAKKSAPL